jgi:four helix bundle protein
MDFAESVYQLTAEFPGDERFSLSAQLRRAVVSIPSNIAEGQGSFTDADFRRFLSIAHGSTREVETQLLLSRRLGYLTDSQLDQLLELSSEVGRLIQGLAKVLDAS